MANPNIAKLSTLPWPTLVGASVLLHAGLLRVGLPQILPVETPGNSSVPIPVTLVNDGDAPVAAPATIPPTAPQQPTPQTAPIGGQNSAVPVGVQTKVPPAPPAPPPEIRQPDPPPETIPKLEAVNPSPQAPNPEAQVPDQNMPDRAPSTEPAPQPSEGTDGNDSTASGPTLVTIRDVNIPEQPNINQAPAPNFQRGISLAIPANFACEGSVSANQPIDVLVEIKGGDGQIAALPDNVFPEVETANCLLMSAIAIDPSRVSFTPATPNTGDYDFAQAESISAIGRLTLVFE